MCDHTCYCIFIFYFFHLVDSRWASALPSCLWTLKIFPSLPGSRLTSCFRDANSALLQLNQWLNFTYSFTHAFHHGRQKNNATMTRIELPTSALSTSVTSCAGHLLNHLGDDGRIALFCFYQLLYTVVHFSVVFVCAPMHVVLQTKGQVVIPQRGEFYSTVQQRLF